MTIKKNKKRMGSFCKITLSLVHEECSEMKGSEDPKDLYLTNQKGLNSGAYKH